MRCLKVPKSRGEEVRKKLLDADILDNRYRIGHEDGHLLIPIKKKIPEGSVDYKFVDRELVEREMEIGDYRNIVDIPERLRDELPASYDIIGDIVVLKIPDTLHRYRREIGNAIIESQKKVITVLEDKGVTGDFRVRDVEHIAGTPKTNTIYREHGMELEVDIADTYFSPRLATERWRVMQRTGDGETVLDMFAGVGPYSILIARNVKIEKVHGIDINPVAVKLLEKNAVRNGVSHLVEAHLGDARDIAPRIDADRVIMNLPHSSFEFLRYALESIRGQGVIHYYEILSSDEIEHRARSLVDDIYKFGYKAEVEEQRVVRTYSASEVHTVYDIMLYV